MDIADFWLLFRGWEKGLERAEMVTRRQTELICEAFIGKGAGVKFVRSAWPFASDTKGNEMGVTDKQLKKLKELREREAFNRVANGDKLTSRGRRKSGNGGA